MYQCFCWTLSSKVLHYKIMSVACLSLHVASQYVEETLQLLQFSKLYTTCVSINIGPSINGLVTDGNTIFAYAKLSWTANLRVRHFHTIWRIGTMASLLANVKYVWSVSMIFWRKICARISHFKVFIVWITGTIFSAWMWEIGTKFSQMWVPNPLMSDVSGLNPHICEKWYQSSHVKKSV